MFGFLRPSCQTTAYRQAYARCCQYQRHHYGLLSLPLLSYEATLLYLVGIDSGAFPRPESDAPTCCRLRSKNGLGRMPEAPLGEFCASLGLLLGAIKLEDDERDGVNPLSRLGNWLMQRRFAAATAYFQTLDCGFETTVRNAVARHLRLEEAGSRIAIEDFARPTGEAFGSTFGLLAKLDGLADQRSALVSLGEQIGQAIIAFDCAVDWRRDQRRGDFNPLADEAEIGRSLRYCAERLRAASHLCRFAFGNRAECVSVVDSVRRRVVARADSNPRTCASFSPRRRLASPGHVYTLMDFGLLGMIDGCCEAAACCDAASCCELGAGGGELGCAGGEAVCAGGEICTGCHCDPCCCACCDPCGSKTAKKTTSDASSTAIPQGAAHNIKLGVQVGDVGVTRSVLRPMGRAVFDGQHVDVTTAGEFVEAGRKVEITAIDNRTVVRPIE